MKAITVDWDEDLSVDLEEEYQAFIRSLGRRRGFGIYFVRCSQIEGEKLIIRTKQDLSHKNIEVLQLTQKIDNLYEIVTQLPYKNEIDILFVQGIEYSLYDYELRTFGEISELQFDNYRSLPRILNHLNQQRERFRDNFNISFVFLVRSVVQQSSHLLLELLLEEDHAKYLSFSPTQQAQIILEIKELLEEEHQTSERKANLWFELGKLLIAAKKYQEALNSFEKGLKIKFNDDIIWYTQGWLLAKLGRDLDAIKSYEQALALGSSHNQMELDFFNCSSSEREIISEAVIVKQKPSYCLFTKDYQKYSSYNNRQKAEIIIKIQHLLEDANKQSSQKAELLFELGNVLVAANKLKQSLFILKQWLEFEPENHENESIWCTRAWLFAKFGDIEEAISSYSKALQIQPNDYQIYYNLGNAFFDLGKYSRAIESYDLALKLKPDAHEVLNNKGNARFRLGHYSRAVASYKKALEISPEDQEIRHNLDKALKSLESYNEIIKRQEEEKQARRREIPEWRYSGVRAEGLRILSTNTVGHTEF